MTKPKIIIVGGGISGLMASLNAAQAGAEVSTFAAQRFRRSPSVCAAGGINAALNTKGQEDSVEEHIYDTIYGGDFLAHQSVIKKMCEAGPEIVHMLARMGVLFNRTQEGLLDQRRMGGVKKNRTCFAGTTTGQQILYALDEQVRRFENQEKISTFEKWEFSSLVLDDVGVCRGIVAIDRNTLETRVFAADAVILCTGGYGEIFKYSTTSIHCTGAAATQVYRQGAIFANPEFIQFHPTTIPGQDKMRQVSESIRGHGGRIWILRDGKPWYFLEEMYPEYKNLVPRDIAARAIFKVVHEMQLGADGQNDVYLDLTNVDPEQINKNLKAAFETYQTFAHQDPRNIPMQVYPAVHYTMGGLWVDCHHQTNIAGLFAAGKCDYQYHGANSLGGNALLSCLYGGQIAGRAAWHYAQNLEKKAELISVSILEAQRTKQEDINKQILNMSGPENPHQLKHELSKALAEHAFIIRDNSGLEKAANKIDELEERFAKSSILDQSLWNNEELFFMRKLYNQLELGRLIVRAAAQRQESRGAHYRLDFSKRDDTNWLKITKAKYTAEGPEFDYDEKVEILDIQPMERKY